MAMHAKGKMKKKGMARGGMKMKKKGMARGGAKMPMAKDPKTGKMVPALIRLNRAFRIVGLV